MKQTPIHEPDYQMFQQCRPGQCDWDWDCYGSVSLSLCHLLMLQCHMILAHSSLEGKLAQTGGPLGFVLFSLLIATQANIRATATKCIETKECSAYEVICTNADYEVRHYNASKWVSTSVQSYFMEMAAYDGFRKLFKYIKGANADGVHIDMTSPVLIKKPEARNMWEPVTYTISFLLPAAYQDAAPAPTNGDVHFLEMPEMHAYVKSFGGWMLSVNTKLYSILLSRELNAASASYNTTFYYGAGYNSPRTVFNRHNEVWYIAEGKPKCSGQQT